MRALQGLGLDWKTIKQVFIVVLWVGAGLVISIVILLIPRLLGLVGLGWNTVIEKVTQPTALIFTVAGVLFVGGRRRAGVAVASTTLALLVALDVFVVMTVR